MRIVSKSKHFYCYQCGTLGSTEQHLDACTLQYSPALQEAVSALVYAYEVLAGNDVLSDYTATQIMPVLSKYPRLRPNETVFLED